MSGQQTTPAPAYCDPDADLAECPNCGGEGGYPSCVEDSCPHKGGEDGCDDPVCWRVCDWCKGRG